jgi:peptide/nickel transport system ATP-binding protein
VAIDRADRILVMKQGEVVEQGPPRQILANPRHDYTRALIAAAPAFASAESHTPGPMQRAHRSCACTTSARPSACPVKGEDPTFVALQDLSLQVYPGQTLAIVGESGSGKSTALRIALGLEKPTQGQV